MSLDYQQVRQQVRELGENAPIRERHLKEQREQALQHLKEYSRKLEALREKVASARRFDPTLRCALPADDSLGRFEALDERFDLPELPKTATILAADGSQIAPDRHAEVLYGLINVGAIQMRLGSPGAPLINVESKLIYDDALFTPSDSLLSEDGLALLRDLKERQMLVELARAAQAPVITFTDGPMELWGAKDAGDSADFKRSLDIYLDVLEALHALGVSTAGYVEKPAAGLVVRLLEVAITPADILPNIKDHHPLRGVSDKFLYEKILEPNERSAVFAMQSKSAVNYKGALGLYFFYLNVGRADHPHLARVEIPAWVAVDPLKLDNLHAALVSQCRIMGSRAYPYLLHRAHEAAVVKQEEKAQVTQMIALELRSRGVEVDEISYKQSAKDLPSRPRY